MENPVDADLGSFKNLEAINKDLESSSNANEDSKINPLEKDAETFGDLKRFFRDSDSITDLSEKELHAHLDFCIASLNRFTMGGRSRRDSNPQPSDRQSGCRYI